MKNFITILALWTLLAAACDPCRDCGLPLRYEPRIQVVFINHDSAEVLKTIIKDITDSMSINTRQRVYLRDTVISDLEKELDTVLARIDSGMTEYEDDRILLEEQIATYQVQADSLASWNAQLNSEKSGFNAILTSINSGLMLLERATMVNTGYDTSFADSARFYRLPIYLDPETTQTDYQLQIAGETYTASITYAPYEFVDETRRTVRIFARNVEVKDHTFHTDTVDCLNPDECLINETTITFYY